MALFFLFSFISNVGWYKCSLGGVHLILQCSMSPLSSGSCVFVKEPQGCPGLLLQVWLMSSHYSLSFSRTRSAGGWYHLSSNWPLSLLTHSPSVRLWVRMPLNGKPSSELPVLFWQTSSLENRLIKYQMAEPGIESQMWVHLITRLPHSLLSTQTSSRKGMSF